MSQQMLSERKQTILKSLIQEYVISVHPVASSTLVSRYVPRLSSATVRNELSWLEDRGYVVSPHTSAGRMPTTAGYRTFVNSLLLFPDQQRFYVKKDESSLTDNTFPAEMAMPRALFTAASSLRTSADKISVVHESLGILAAHNKNLMVFWAPQLSNSIIHQGLPLLLSQPEFAESRAALPIMQLLESHGDLMIIFEDIVNTGGLHIKIGSEHKDPQLYEFSMVAMRFNGAHLTSSKVGGQTAFASKATNYGVVALFGPTRLDYEWAIRSISSLVKDLEHPGRL